jgi:Tol biopolymer transport system component
VRAGVALAALLLTSGRAANGQETQRVSVDSAGTEANGDCYASGAVISANGRYVVFASAASDLVANDTNGFVDVFVHDRSTGVTERVSVDSTGAESDADNSVWQFAISADGSCVAFVSLASNLVSNDTNQNEDVFVHDRVTGSTERVNVDSSGGQAAGGSLYPGSYDPSISADGRYVAFDSFAANLVIGDTNGTYDVFVHDRVTGVTERVSVDSSGAEANDANGYPAISADGRFVAFLSLATNLVPGDGNGRVDAFVHDRTTGVTERISVDDSGSEGDGDSAPTAISADGRIVAFVSDATNLVVGDTNGTRDVFAHDRLLATTERVNVATSGSEATGTSYTAALSADGNLVVFDSDAPDLVSGDTNGAWDVFRHDRTTGITDRVSVDSSGAEGLVDSYGGAISGDGRVVAFESAAANFVANDTNGCFDVFVRFGGPASGTNYGAGVAGTNGVPSLTSQLPVLGTTITVAAGNSLGAPTVGILFLGYQRAQLPTRFGGDLLLLPALVVPISFSYGANSFTGALPDDDVLCGFVLDLQAVEADPGALLGVSFTEGLELVLGR